MLSFRGVSGAPWMKNTGPRALSIALCFGGGQGIHFSN